MLQIELNEIECEKIVKKAAKSENVKIIERKLENFGNDYGFLGEYFRLDIEAEMENVRTKFNFFVKSLPIKNLKQRNMLVETGIFRKEVIIYEKLLLHLNELSGKKNFWCAEVFLFRDDLLVLENLSLKGYKMLPFRFRFEICHVKATLKSLASFHASSIFYEETNGEKSIEKEFKEVLFETSVANIKWYHAGLKTIYDVALQKTKYGKTHSDLLKVNLYEKLFESIENMESNPQKIITVLAHRDLWKNNLMFTFADENSYENPLQCILLDFQTVRYLPLSIDVVMAVICNTTRDHHEKNFKSYIKFYYQNLSKELQRFNLNLSSKMSFELFEKSCEYHKTLALIYNAVVVMITMAPPDYFTNFTEDQYKEYVEGNRSKFIFDIMEKDQVYRENLIEAIEAVIEFIFPLS